MKRLMLMTAILTALGLPGVRWAEAQSPDEPDPAKVTRLQKMAEAMRLMHEASAP